MNSDYTYKTIYGYEYTNSFGLKYSFINDFFTLSISEFIEEYRHLPYKTRSDMNGKYFSYCNEGDGYIELRGLDYYQVPSTKRFKYSKKKNKSVVDKITKENRDTQFIIDGKTFLKISEQARTFDMTKETFVYDMVRVIDKFYDNSDGGITKEYIIENCKYVWELYYCVNRSVSVVDKKFEIDKDYWKERGITNSLEISNIIKKRIKDNDLRNSWCSEISLEDNLEMFKEYGIKIRKDNLIKWLNDNGYSYFTKKDLRNKVILEVYNEDTSRSLREIVNIVNERGYKVNKDTVRKIINKSV